MRLIPPFSIIILAAIMTAGCATKLPQTSQSIPVTVSTGQDCTTYFIANDEIKYTFKNSETKQVDKGRYLIIGACPKAQLVFYNYTLSGDAQEFAYGPGAKISPMP